MNAALRIRFRLIYLLLGVVLLSTAYATVRGFRYRPSKPVAPQAVALVRRYLQALQQGDRSRACRIFPAPSVCAARAAPQLERFTVSSAEPTVDGVQVPATIDSQPAVFQLAGGPINYRIVDVIADPTLPGPAVGPP
jgi:hypothetical protein